MKIIYTFLFTFLNFALVAQNEFHVFPEDDKKATFVIKDVENHKEILKSGILGKDKKVVFPMKLNGNDKNKSLDNFGVFIIEFDKSQTRSR